MHRVGFILLSGAPQQGFPQSTKGQLLWGWPFAFQVLVSCSHLLSRATQKGPGHCTSKTTSQVGAPPSRWLVWHTQPAFCRPHRGVSCMRQGCMVTTTKGGGGIRARSVLQTAHKEKQALRRASEKPEHLS